MIEIDLNAVMWWLSPRGKRAAGALIQDIFALPENEILRRARDLLLSGDVEIRSGHDIKKATQEDLDAQCERVQKVVEAANLIRSVKANA